MAGCVSKINGCDIKDKTARQQIRDEIASRGAADATMSARIEEERLQRQNGVTAANSAIQAEAAARKNEIAIERARIDQLSKLPVGSTAGDAELADLRIDIHGKTHESAGAAVRAQVSMLAETISNQTLSFVDGKLLISSGSEQASEGWSLSNPIYLTYGMKLYVKTKLTGVAAIGFFDIKGKMLSATTYPEGIVADNNSVMYEFTLDAPEGTFYAKISCYSTLKQNADFAIKNVLEGICELNSAIYHNGQEISNNASDIAYILSNTPVGNAIDDSIPLELGYIDAATGAVKDSTNIWHTDYVPLKANTRYYVSKKFHLTGLYAFYDADKKRITDETITIFIDENGIGYFDTTKKSKYMRLSSIATSIKGAYISEFNDGYKPFGFDFSGLVPDVYNRIEALESKAGTLAGKKVLVLGDSITDNTYRTPGTAPWNKWASYLAETIGFELTNDSIHATGFIADNTTADKSKNLVNRITAHTAAEQYDLIVIFLGVNEHIQGNPIGDSSSTDKNAYVIPAMRYCLDYLANTFPTAKICALLPLPYVGGSVTSSLADYVNAIQSVYNEYSIPTLDLFRAGGFRPKNQTFRNTFTMLAGDASGNLVNDGVHPNKEWDNNYLAPMIKNFLMSLL